VQVEMCAVLRYYAASNCNPLTTFRGKISVPFSRVKKSKNKRVQVSSTSRRKPEITDI
jgi:hypothetical protein